MIYKIIQIVRTDNKVDVIITNKSSIIVNNNLS